MYSGHQCIHPQAPLARFTALALLYALNEEAAWSRTEHAKGGILPVAKWNAPFPLCCARNNDGGWGG